MANLLLLKTDMTKLPKHGTGGRPMAQINNEVFDRPIKPAAARALIATVRDIAPYLTIGECCSIVAVVQNAIKRMEQEDKR
jgi:hypothetical protein